MSEFNRSILSSQARIQAPWVKVTIGNYTFGAFNQKEKAERTPEGFYTAYHVTYPNYVQSLTINKINGQVNQYTLSISYPVRSTDDPNFFEKVFSSVSSTRKIKFSYGDTAMPNYIYKDEEALIINIQQSFNLVGSVINYTISAVSSAALSKSGSYTFIHSGKIKPSDEIKRILKDSRYGLSSIFTAMNASNLDTLIAGDDKYVEVGAKRNISALDYINYLVSCMLPAGSSSTTNRSKDIYILTIHDDTTYDTIYSDNELVDGKELKGSYLKVTRVSYLKEHADAYVIDVGYNTSTIVTNFSIDDNENYSILYDYQSQLTPEQYVRRLNDEGQWEDAFAPAVTSNNLAGTTRAEDISWWTKVTKYPIKASITIQGLLRPAHLMTYVRLNIIFPGGHKHIASGLYIITQQRDQIDYNGYRTTLSLTRISGDTEGDDLNDR